MKDYSSIVISSSVKFRRNLLGFDFPSVLDGLTGIKVLNKLADTILKLDDDFKIYKLKTLSEIDKQIMFEKDLISSRLLENDDFSATILSKDESISIMLNEEDHIVETCKIAGLNLILAYDSLNSVDNEILSKLDIAYDEDFGFLTSNIANVGTGIETTVKMFLPGLLLTGKIKDIQNEINSQALGIRLTNDTSLSYQFSISNVQTIGKRERDYVIKITEFAIRVSELEILARKELLTNLYVSDIKDKIYRAWGILTNCYKISEEEARQLLSDLKIGVALDFLRFKDVSSIDNLMVDVLPYSLTKISDVKVSEAELDKYRAKFLANILKTKRIK